MSDNVDTRKAGALAIASGAIKGEPADETESVPLTKEKKLKKPKTEKQMEAFKKVVEKRKENIEKKKLEKKIEASKLLLQHNIEVPAVKETSKVKQLPKADDDEYETKTDSEQSSSEDEIFIKQPKSKQQKPKSKTKAKKKKVTKVVYVEHASSDSSSESESLSETEKEEKQARQRHFTSQRNKKSLVKVQAPPPQMPTRNFMNYFAD